MARRQRRKQMTNLQDIVQSLETGLSSASPYPRLGVVEDLVAVLQHLNITLPTIVTLQPQTTPLQLHQNL
jgi:hypothetical protein